MVTHQVEQKAINAPVIDGTIVHDDVDHKLHEEPRHQDDTPAVGGYALDNLTRWQATRILWRPTIFCVCAGLCILMEGYQGSITGKSVASY